MIVDPRLRDTWSSQSPSPLRTVVITGVSSGIGRATAALLLRRGWRVFGSVRHLADAGRLSDQLGANFVPFLCDVTDGAAIAQAAREVAAALGQEPLSALVNNVGIVVSGPLLDLPVTALRRQLEVNLVAPFAVTQAFAPLLATAATHVAGPGRIVMISSVSGRQALPFGGFYSASKFGLEGLSESLRRELMLFGVDVVVVAPGPTNTPLWRAAEPVNLGRFAGSPYAPALARFAEVMRRTGRGGQPPERVARTIVHALTVRRPCIRYTVDANRVRRLLDAFLPRRIADWHWARALGLSPPS